MRGPHMLLESGRVPVALEQLALESIVSLLEGANLALETLDSMHIRYVLLNLAL